MSEKEQKPTAGRARRGAAEVRADDVAKDDVAKDDVAKDDGAELGVAKPGVAKSRIMKARVPKTGAAKTGAAKAGPARAVAVPAPRPLGRPPLLDDPRAEILQQAARLFAEKGFASGSLAELASAMNYSKGAIYNYFSSKQEIYDAIIIFTLTGLYETAAAAVRREDPPVQQLRQYMMAHARFLADNYDCFVTMLVGFSGMANSELKDDALALRDAHEGLLRQIIADGVADGSFRPVGAAMTGRAVLSLLSWMVRWFKPGRGKSAEQVADEYHDLLVRGLLPD